MNQPDVRMPEHCIWMRFLISSGISLMSFRRYSAINIQLPIWALASTSRLLPSVIDKKDFLWSPDSYVTRCDLAFIHPSACYLHFKKGERSQGIGSQALISRSLLCILRRVQSVEKRPIWSSLWPRNVRNESLVLKPRSQSRGHRSLLDYLPRRRRWRTIWKPTRK